MTQEQEYENFEIPELQNWEEQLASANFEQEAKNKTEIEDLRPLYMTHSVYLFKKNRYRKALGIV